MSEDWRIGDHRVIDDITGFKIWASEARKQWNGSLTDEKNYSPRHQQDLIRARRENPGVKNARPEPPDTFIGPLTTTVTAAAIAGATTLEVASTAGMTAADRISVMLESADTFRTTIQTVTDATHLEIATALPGHVGVGKMIVNNSALTAPTLP